MNRLPPGVRRAADLAEKLLAGTLSPESFVREFEDVLMEDDSGDTSSGAYYKIFNVAAEWVGLFNSNPALRAESRHLIDDAALRLHMKEFLAALGISDGEDTPSPSPRAS